MSRFLVFCATCGSLDLEYEAWVDANREGKVYDASRDGEAWCPRCEEHEVETSHIEVAPDGATTEQACFRLSFGSGIGIGDSAAPKPRTWPSLRACIRDVRTVKNPRKARAE